MLQIIFFSPGRQFRDSFKTYSGEKSNKYNQCDFACTDPNALQRHLNIYSGVKTKQMLGNSL